MEVRNYFEIFKNRLDYVKQNEVMQLIDDIIDVYERNGMIFTIGNGGSAAKASHVAQDLAKGVLPNLATKKRIKALSLTDNIPYITALGNDNGYENIYLAQLVTFDQEGDCLIAISGSGNSPNVIKAVEYCKKQGIKVIGVTGFDGGKLRKLSDTSVHVPLNEMAMVESIHSVIFHYVINYLRMKLTGDKFDESIFTMSEE